jgi:hypothetical protein
MMYKALRQWRDLEDNHIYNAGDAFPHDGREIAPARLAALSTGANKAKMRLIEAVDEQGKEIPAEAPETPQKPRKRGRKR